MIFQVLQCPYYQGIDIVKNGKTPQGKQRFLSRESLCDGRTFILDYAYLGQSRQVKEQIVDMATPVACDVSSKNKKKRTSAPTSQFVSLRATQSRTS